MYTVQIIISIGQLIAQNAWPDMVVRFRPGTITQSGLRGTHFLHEVISHFPWILTLGRSGSTIESAAALICFGPRRDLTLKAESINSYLILACQVPWGSREPRGQQLHSTHSATLTLYCTTLIMWHNRSLTGAYRSSSLR